MGSKTPAITQQQGTGTSVADPWSAATPMLQGIIGDYGGLTTSITPEQAAAGQALTQGAQGIQNLSPEALQNIQSTYNYNAGLLPSTWGQVSGNLSPIAGMSANPMLAPGIGDALSTMNQDITNQVKGMYAGAGRSPSGAGAMPQTLARGLSQGEGTLLANTYQNQLQNILAANQQLTGGASGTTGAMNTALATMLSGAGQLPGLQMAPSQAQWAAANMQQQQPFANIAPLLQAGQTLGGMGGTTQTQTQQYGTQTPANDPLSNILGGLTAAAGIAGAFAKSDRRLKTDIKDIGRTHDNQKIYSYRFKGENMPQIGMMADEVEKKTPQAVATDPAGYKRVRYDMATRKAATMGMLPARQAA